MGITQRAGLEEKTMAEAACFADEVVSMGVSISCQRRCGIGQGRNGAFAEASCGAEAHAWRRREGGLQRREQLHEASGIFNGVGWRRLDWRSFGASNVQMAVCRLVVAKVRNSFRRFRADSARPMSRRNCSRGMDKAADRKQLVSSSAHCHGPLKADPVGAHPLALAPVPSRQGIPSEQGAQGSEMQPNSFSHCCRAVCFAVSRVFPLQQSFGCEPPNRGRFSETVAANRRPKQICRLKLQHPGTPCGPANAMASHPGTSSHERAVSCTRQGLDARSR